MGRVCNHYNEGLDLGYVIKGDGSWFVTKTEGQDGSCLTVTQAFQAQVKLSQATEDDLALPANADPRLLDKSFVVIHDIENGEEGVVDAGIFDSEPYEGQPMSRKLIAHLLTDDHKLDPSGLQVNFNYGGRSCQNFLKFVTHIGTMDVRRAVTVSNYTPIK